MPKSSNSNSALLAKPSGITLEQHTSDVMSEAECLCHFLKASCLKYDAFTMGKSLTQRVVIAAKIHDLGKQCPQWQTACRQDYNSFSEWKKEHPQADFEEYEKEVGTDAGKAIRKSNIRHEFYSLKHSRKKKLPLPLQAAIAAHHSKLSHAFEKRWEDGGFKEYWNDFVQESNAIIEKEDFTLLAAKAYEFNGVRGLLRLADHRASAQEENEAKARLIRFEYQFPFPTKRGVQKLMEEHWQEDILLVRAPTGAGKTDAALLWASQQVQNQRADRVIMAMPTRFTSNALAINVADALSDTGLYHSSAWLTASLNSNKQEASAHSQHARLLLTPLTVCTIDHLLMSLTITREEHHLIGFNMANACLVIDEADFYDDFTMANIMFLLKVMREWKVPVLMMSASMPSSMPLLINSYAGFNVQNILEDTADTERIRFELAEKVDYEDFPELIKWFDLCINKGNGIIYVNTVEKAIACYSCLEQRLWETGKGVRLYLYHSHFTETDKQKKEQELIEALGRKAWEEGKASGIAILTQIGEMSINISSEIMLSDLCPIDRLIQRVGRLCRFDKAKRGVLYLLRPKKNGNLYPAPYGEYDPKNNNWTPSQHLASTDNRLDLGGYSSNRLTQMLNDEYHDKHHLSYRAEKNAQSLKEMFVNNWLINPKEQTNREDEDTMEWKSRDIGPQKTVFVRKPESKRMSKRDFQEYELLHGINIPLYKLSKIRKAHRIDQETVLVGNTLNEQALPIDIVREGFYDERLGLNFSTSKEEEDNFL